MADRTGTHGCRIARCVKMAAPICLPFHETDCPWRAPSVYLTDWLTDLLSTRPPPRLPYTFVGPLATASWARAYTLHTRRRRRRRRGRRVTGWWRVKRATAGASSPWRSSWCTYHAFKYTGLATERTVHWKKKEEGRGVERKRGCAERRRSEKVTIQRRKAHGTRPELRANDTVALSILSTFTVNPRAHTFKHFCHPLPGPYPSSLSRHRPSRGEYGVLSYRSADGAYTQPERTAIRTTVYISLAWGRGSLATARSGSAALLSLLFFSSSVFTLPSPTVRLVFSTDQLLVIFCFYLKTERGFNPAKRSLMKPQPARCRYLLHASGIDFRYTVWR